MPVFRVAISGDFLNERGEDAYGGLPLQRFDETPHVRYHFTKNHAPRAGDAGYWDRFYSLQMSAEDMRDLDGLIVLRPRVTRDVLAGAPDLVVIGRSGAGYDKVDVPACTEFDVALFNAPMALNHSTASTALMFMLALAKRLIPQEKITRAGRWDLQAAELGHEILGRTLGIVGLGNSGRELVRLVAPFSMNVIAYSPHADPAQAAALSVRLTSLDEVMSQSDFVSVHARLTAENRGGIGAAQLALMQPHAYFINVGRGELVDQAALTDCLQARRIAGAGLDVFTVEPLPAADPLTQLDNVILTPHWSASTRDVWRATGKAMIEGMLRASQGLVPENVVNREVLDRPRFREKLARFAGHSL